MNSGLHVKIIFQKSLLNFCTTKFSTLFYRLLTYVSKCMSMSKCLYNIATLILVLQHYNYTKAMSMSVHMRTNVARIMCSQFEFTQFHA
jgi:hypothetical protein